VRVRRALAIMLVLALGGWEPFRTRDPDVEAGNRAYAEGRYDDALAAYGRAARRGDVDPDGLAFDRGTAELKKSESLAEPTEKQRLAERALEDLKQAARARDPHVRGAASYNRGNALMGQDHLDDAIEAYKQALRDDPELDDARLNLELALRRRQKQQQRQQQGQGQGQGGQQGPQGQQGPRGGGSNQPQDDQRGSGQGSDQNGSGGQGSDAQNGSGGGGSNQPPNDPNGQNGQNGSNQGSDAQNGGQGSNQQPGGQSGSNDGSNGGGSSAQQSDQDRQNGQNAPPSKGPPSNGRPQRGRSTPHSPKTPTDGKLDDLDNYSRRLQKDQSRRRATGRSTDPQHDW
jgi:hypothetical protein